MAASHDEYLGGSGNGTAGQTSTVLSVSKTVTAGNVLVVGWFGYGDITPSGVTDNLGNSYSRVERTRNASGMTADLWWAPISTGGTLTTITVAHASTQYVGVVAAEIVGVKVSGAPTAGGGTTGTGTTGTWVSNKTIPDNGMAIGMIGCLINDAETAGAASGDPSTRITLSGFFDGGGNVSGSLCYAIAGASDVTGFNGTTAIASSGVWAGAGAIFDTSGTVYTLAATGAISSIVGALVLHYANRPGSVTSTDSSAGSATSTDARMTASTLAVTSASASGSDAGAGIGYLR